MRPIRNVTVIGIMKTLQIGIPLLKIIISSFILVMLRKNSRVVIKLIRLMISLNKYGILKVISFQKSLGSKWVDLNFCKTSKAFVVKSTHMTTQEAIKNCFEKILARYPASVG
jgi:hypothetical protein